MIAWYELSPREKKEAKDPICEVITHYRRVGKMARYAFLCSLVSSGPPTTKAASFWLPYTTVCESCKEALKEQESSMSEKLGEYSDGEDAWESASDGRQGRIVIR